MGGLLMQLSFQFKRFLFAVDAAQAVHQQRGAQQQQLLRLPQALARTAEPFPGCCQLAYGAQGEEIQINANRKLFSLMTNIQDEVHRFSLSFQQQTHKKKTYELELTKIKGIGEAKALALIKHFKTKQALKDASPDEIASVAKVKEEKAIEIYDFIKENF